MPSNIKLFEPYNYNKIFIETGSYAGDGIKSALFAGYKKIYSIEITDKWYYHCKEFFKYLNHIELLHGDTVSELPKILAKITEPATIWLDAHYSGGDTDFKDVLSPLIQELDVIAKHKVKTHTIIIDDLREWRSDYPAIGFGYEEIKNKLLSINPKYMLTLHDGHVPQDILIASIKRYKPINIIVFSKDRAMQLELFLRSFTQFVSNVGDYQVKVLYTYSNDNYKRGYDKLIEHKLPNVEWVKETNFKNDLLGLINFNNQHTVFFVDDNIFKTSFDFYDNQMTILNDTWDIACRSLRLHRDLKYCYPKRQPMRQPAYGNNNIFTWVGADGDYGYPMSLDGHIFRTEDIAPYLKDGDYSNPNLLESIMAGNPIKRQKMICYNQSVIMNNPINKVQTLNNNIHGNITAELLNNKWLNGERIKLDTFVGFNNISCHQEIALQYERDSD